MNIEEAVARIHNAPEWRGGPRIMSADALADDIGQAGNSLVHWYNTAMNKVTEPSGAMRWRQRDELTEDQREVFDHVQFLVRRLGEASHQIRWDNRVLYGIATASVKRKSVWEKLAGFFNKSTRRRS